MLVTFEHNSDNICVEINVKKAEACRNTLFISNPDTDREELISAKGIRVPGTCEWIKGAKNFMALEKGEISLLWITGEPGKGKTMLSIFITEELEHIFLNSKDRNVVYHFCVHKKRDTGIALLRGLLYQILNKRRELTKDVLSYFETPEKTEQALSSLETLWIIFLKLVKHPKLGVMLCVVDGLDECDEGSREFLLPRFVHNFGSSQPATPTQFRLVVISRALEGLEECKKIDLDNDPESRGQRDMQLFVREKVDELFRKKRFDDSFRPIVQSALLSKAGDTFLWVGFVVNDLLKLRTWSQVQEQLKSLPDGLSSIYGRMLLEIPPKERKMALSILRWVCLARKPLDLLELAEMMALQQQASSPFTFTRPKKALDFVVLKQHVRDAIGLCGQILRLKHEEVTFVHKTARDFLLREEREENEVLRLFQLHIEETSLLLVRDCFQSIKQSDLYASISDQDRQLSLKFSPFLRYAIKHWHEHVRSCSHRARDLFDDFCSVFESNPSFRQYWWKRYRMQVHIDEPYAIPLLHMVSYLGVSPWIEALLERDFSISDSLNEQDGMGMRPIDWACEGRNEEVAERLLAHTAHIKNTAWDRFLVKEAIIWSNPRILRMLLERGADLNLKYFDGVSGLHTAVSSESAPEILNLLLEGGANLESKNSMGYTPLHKAVLQGKESIALFLIEAGADTRIKDRAGKTLLQAACSSNMERVVKKLLHMGFDIKAKDKFNATMLHIVAGTEIQEEDQALARLLMSKGLDVRAKDNYGKTPLHKAAESGNSALVQLFVEHGADINAKDHRGDMPLHSALRYKGYGEAARILVDNGADVNAPDVIGLIPLRDYIRKHEYELSMKYLQTPNTCREWVLWEP